MSLVTALPADLLRCIFGQSDPQGQAVLPTDFRRRVLPLVCKPFAEAIQGPSHLWRKLDIDAEQHATLAGGRLRWARASRWVIDRAVCVEELRLVPKHAAPAGRLAPLWGALAGRLRRLDLQLERELPLTSEQEDLQGLSALAALQELRLTGPAAPSCKVSAALAAGLAPLTQLRALTLKLQACPFTMLRPDLPAVLLGALVNLRSLDVDLASFAPPPSDFVDDGAGEAGGGEQAPPPSPKSAAGNNMLPACITHLTHLQYLRLSGDWRRPKVELPPNFAQLTALQEVHFEGLYVAPTAMEANGFTPPPQAAPRALAALTLQDCLGDFPFGSALRNLRTLRVEACDEMHMAAAALQALRDAPRLTATVVIRDSSMEHLPSFLDGMPPATRLTSKPALCAS